MTDNFTGNVRARPQIGYKYFLKRNVALDFSVGYTFEVNQDDEFRRNRVGFLDGQVGLSFIF